MRKMTLLITLAIALLQSCNYEEWRYEKYTYEGGPENRFRGENKNSEVQFVLDDIQIIPILAPAINREQPRTLRGPYRFIITARSTDYRDELLYVDPITVHSSLGKDFDIPSASTSFEFQPVSQTYFASIEFNTALNLDFKNDEKLTITCIIGFEADEKGKSKRFTFDFYPYLDDGSGFIPISV